jgi:hypothetical protein
MAAEPQVVDLESEEEADSSNTEKDKNDDTPTDNNTEQGRKSASAQHFQFLKSTNKYKCNYCG